MADTTLEWRIDAANSAAVRAVCYAWIGTLGGAALVVLASVGVGALRAAAAGDLAPLAFALLFVLVGGPFSLLYVLPAVRRSDYRPSLSLLVPDPAADPEEPLAERYAAVFAPRRLLAAAVLGALVLSSLALVDVRVLGALVGLLFVALVAASGLTAWGRLSPREPKLEYRTGTVPLESVRGVRRFDLGGTVCYWVSYRERSIGTPSLLAFTPEAARVFEDVLESLEPADPADAEPRNWAVTVAAGAIGLAFLAFAAGVLVADAVPLEIGAYAALMTGMLGVLFVWAAYAMT